MQYLRLRGLRWHLLTLGGTTAGEVQHAPAATVTSLSVVWMAAGRLPKLTIASDFGLIFG